MMWIGMDRMDRADLQAASRDEEVPRASRSASVKSLVKTAATFEYYVTKQAFQHSTLYPTSPRINDAADRY
jgi:hypothetical protein